MKTGDWVDRNTVLGKAGDSGLSGAGYVHLHFERRLGHLQVDPVPLGACHGDQLKSYPGEFGGKTSWSQVTTGQYTQAEHHAGGTVAGMPVRGSVVSDDRGWSFSLGPAWLRECPVVSGAHVPVTIAPEGPQRDDLAPDLAAALERIDEVVALLNRGRKERPRP